MVPATDRRWYLLAAAACLALAAPAHGHSMDENIEATYDVPNENYLVGYLTWKDGKHGLAWQPEGGSDAAGGPTTSSTTAQVFTFRSDPIPFDVFVNVSRNLHAEFFVKTGGPSTDFVAKVDGQILGGTAFTTSGWTPQAPSGYLAKSIRFHSEFSYLKAGTVIEFSYRSTAQGQFKVTGDDRSRFWIPAYAPHEIAIRQPYLGPATAPGGTGAGESDASGSPEPPLGAAHAILGMTLLVSPSAARRRLRSLLVFGALLGLSGCLGDPGPAGDADSTTGPGATRGRADTTISPDEENQTGLATGATGAIVGRVADSDGFPISRAHVSVVKTPNFTTTDAGGNFRFQGIVPDSYTLRVSHSLYRTLESTIVVKARSITRVDVVLEALAGEGQGDFRRHRHNLWGEKTQELILETDVNVHTSYGTAFCCSPNAFNYAPYTGDTPASACVNLVASRRCGESFIVPTPDPTRPALVRPGTVDVEVKVTWETSGSTVTNVGVGYKANDQTPDQFGTVNWTMMYPRGNGASTHIRTNQEMTDAGHQHYSTWEFAVFLVPDPAATIPNPLHVAITIHRGFVPLEPPHTDYWGANQTLTLLDKARITRGNVVIPSAYPDTYAGWTPARIVPPETTWLEVTLTPDKAGTTNYDWQLQYKTALYGPQPAGDYSKFTAISHTRKDGLAKTYVIVPGPDDPDPFYSKASNWRFLLDDRQSPVSAGGETTDPPALLPEAINFDLSVVAHRDPAPK